MTRAPSGTNGSSSPPLPSRTMSTSSPALMKWSASARATRSAPPPLKSGRMRATLRDELRSPLPFIDFQTAGVGIGQIFVQADPPVAHHIETAKVELFGQQPLRGRPHREIFL